MSAPKSLFLPSFWSCSIALILKNFLTCSCKGAFKIPQKRTNVQIIERKMQMEGSFISVDAQPTRASKDRALRSYRMLSGVLRSSRSYGRYFSADDLKDDAAIEAQMYSLREAVLAVEDARERLILYHYYIKGQNMDVCAKILGVSLRTANRIKTKALDSIKFQSK